jgi:hypothetical protein
VNLSELPFPVAYDNSVVADVKGRYLVRFVIEAIIVNTLNGGKGCGGEYIRKGEKRAQLHTPDRRFP